MKEEIPAELMQDGCAVAHRARRLPVAPAAVDAADLRLRAGEGETLEVRPETQERIWAEGNVQAAFLGRKTKRLMK